jgi:DNA-binding transcriptional regulator YdaS (Cro superfamily)
MLNSVDDVVDALGGTASVASLLGVGPSAVSNWRARGKIPEDNFLLVRDALKANGRGEADPSVFGFKTEARP